MENITQSHDATAFRPQPDTHYSSKSNFKEAIQKQNIDSMIEIYGEEYLIKIGILTPS